MIERIQKVLATAGVASRRAVEDMIREGRVLVNGRPAEIGQKVTHEDKIRVDNRSIRVERKPQAVQLLLYRKKVGEVVTREDPEGRRTVFRKLPELETGRWIAVGRLDINTSGLLLLSNDGELARRLTHPSFEVPREYAVRVLGSVDAEVLARLRAGVKLEDGLAKFDSIVPGENEDDEEGSANSWWIVTLREGRNREVRRLFESQKLQVSRLIRVAYGPLQLGRGIKAGSYREASAEELQSVLEAVGLAEPPSPAKTSSRTKTRTRTGKLIKPALTAGDDKGSETRSAGTARPARKAAPKAAPKAATRSDTRSGPRSEPRSEPKTRTRTEPKAASKPASAPAAPSSRPARPKAPRRRPG